jgi:tryptophan-rich sensory protein
MEGARSITGLVLWVGICLAVGYLGSLVTRPGTTTWYIELAKPSFTPPAWIFAPVWTVLYVMMGTAAWLVWRERGFGGAGTLLGLFLGHLLLNLGWSALFFGLRRPGAAFAEILVLLAAVTGLLLAFYRVRPIAGLLLAPYFLWTAFAALLNFRLWRLNLEG